MLAAAIPVARPAPDHPARRRLSRRRLGPMRGRDPLRFGNGMVRTAAVAAPAAASADSGLRLFAHAFGAAFLFVSVFLA